MSERNEALTPSEFLDTAPEVPAQLTCTRPDGACLVQIHPLGPGLGERYALGDGSVIVGRDRTCAMCIDDPSVSRRHAEIRAAPSGHYLIDLRSTNGSFVNDRPATASRLGDGDYVRIGNRVFRYLTADNVESLYHEEIYRLTIIDSLTGIHNKRFLVEFLERELARSARHRRPLALALLDVDHFKAINDRIGHLGGDYVLRELAGCVQGLIGKDDVLARYGGEEFAIVMPETGAEEAQRRGEAIRQNVESHLFNHAGESVHVTVSLGIVAAEVARDLTLGEFIRRADEKLYLAKQAGRNCVMT